MTEPLITLPVSDYNRLVEQAVKDRASIKSLCEDVVLRVEEARDTGYYAERDPWSSIKSVLNAVARGEPLPPKVAT